MSPKSYIFLDDQLTNTQRYYTDPVDILIADDPGDIDDIFAKLTQYHQEGYFIAGYLSYDLGYVFEDALSHRLAPKRPTPLLNFGIFKTFERQAPTQLLYSSQAPDLTLTPLWSEAEYSKRFSQVMDYIRAGDVYQINLTFPMTGPYDGPAHTLYAAFRHRQKGRYGGVVHLGNAPDIISLSPELFFRKEGRDMSMRPMKGTRPRSANSQIDEELRLNMRNDVKSQAENLMIVDLLRNDLSRISEPGSVKVPELFALETYETLHQMTSRVVSKLTPDIDMKSIFQNLFPCGSVTGAPKIRAMEIIDDLETTPRGAYCGALGYIDPNGDACFNVGIRTLTLSGKRLTYNVGSGLVYDSQAQDEYHECLLKADVLSQPPADIIETCLWTPKDGIVRGKAHKARMMKSAKALGYPFNPAQYDALTEGIKTETNDQHIRMTLSADGDLNLSQKDFVSLDRPKIMVSPHKLSKKVQYSKHKISRRNFYDKERERLKALTGIDEVIFLNESGKLCEGSFTSIFIEKDGKLLTPALKTGILPGVLRAELLRSKKARTADLTEDDLLGAKNIYIGNSMRGLMPAALITE